MVREGSVITLAPCWQTSHYLVTYYWFALIVKLVRSYLFQSVVGSGSPAVCFHARVLVNMHVYPWSFSYHCCCPTHTSPFWQTLSCWFPYKPVLHLLINSQRQVKFHMLCFCVLDSVTSNVYSAPCYLAFLKIRWSLGLISSPSDRVTGTV